MSAQNLTKLRELDETILQNEALVASIIDLRKRAGMEPSKTIRQRLVNAVFKIIEPSIIVALITAILGGLIVPSILSSVQHTRAVLDTQRQTAVNAIESAGRMIWAINGLLAIPTDQYNPEVLRDPKTDEAKKERDRLEEQKIELAKTYNKEFGDWQMKKSVLSLQVSLSFSVENKSATANWKTLTIKIDELSSCAEERYYAYQNHEAPNKSRCSDEQLNDVMTAIDTEIDALGSNLMSGHDRGWRSLFK